MSEDNRIFEPPGEAPPRRLDTDSEDSRIFEPPGEAPTRRSRTGTGTGTGTGTRKGASKQPPTVVGAAQDSVTPPEPITPTASPMPVAPAPSTASGRLPMSRGAWLAYAGGAFVVTLVIIIGARLLVRGGGDAGPENGPENGHDANPTYEPTPAPTWNAAPLAGVTLPPLRAAQYPGEPAAYVMEDRIWDFVGPGWGLGVFRYNVDLEPRDTAAFQGIYLISPEGYPFFLHKLRTDFYLGVVHWEPAERMAWVSRCEEGDSCQVVEFQLVPGDAVDAWVMDAGAATTMWDAGPLTSLANGTTVWRVATADMPTRSLLVRAPGGPTVMLDAFRSMEGDATRGWTPYWIDATAGIAYVRTDTLVAGADSYHFDSAWSTVNLTTGAVTALAAVAKEPSDFVAFQTGFDAMRAWDDGRCEGSGRMIDGWLLEYCGEMAVVSPDLPGTYLVDPTGVAEPIAYGGALPSFPRTSEETAPEAFGLSASSGWGYLSRALPLP